MVNAGGFFVKKNKIICTSLLIIAILALAIVFPGIITMIWSGKIPMVDNKLQHSGYIVELQDGSGIDMEEFIPCVIMAQLDYDTADEAVKAQIVINRTKIVKKMGENRKIAVKDLKLPYITYEQLEETYGDKFEEMYNRLIKLENETNQNIITYNGKPINAYYHSVSSGVTRNGGKDYLKSVESPDDLTADNYLSILYYTPDEFEAALKNADSNISINKENPMDGIVVTPEDGTGYVSEVSINDIKVTGNDFYKSMKLASPCFSIEKFNEAIRIVVKGIGNGKGLSIYGADKMAESGKLYKEILAHYYSGVDFESCKNVQTSSNAS